MRELTTLAVIATALYSPFAISVDQIVLVVARIWRICPSASLGALGLSGGFVSPFSFHRLGRSGAARVLEFALLFIVSGTETVLFPSVADATR